MSATRARMMVPSPGDEQDVLLRLHQQLGGQGAGLVGDHHGADALAVAGLLPVLAAGGTLAVALGGDDQHLGSFLNAGHVDDVVALLQADGLHAMLTRPQVRICSSLKRMAHAVAGTHEDLVVPAGEGHVHQLVPLLEDNGDEAVFAQVLELGHGGLFNHAAPGGHHQGEPGGVRGHGDHVGDLFPRRRFAGMFTMAVPRAARPASGIW